MAERPDAPRMPRASLRRRILLGLLGYAALLTLAIAGAGIVFNEHAEQLVWRTLLDYEADRIAEGLRQDPGRRWPDTPSLSIYDKGDPLRQPPPAMARLRPGVHDDVPFGGGIRVVLVREIGGRELVLALDISELEQRERDMALTLIGAAAALVLLLTIAIAWSVNRLVDPLGRLALRVGHLAPHRPDERIEVPANASAELVTIADAFNAYLQRNQAFVRRERAFIDMASHELRTPVAVIAGASEVALAQPRLDAGVRKPLERIRRTATDVEGLIALLLVLAKDPARVAAGSEEVALHVLLPAIVEDHRHLTRGKQLELELAPLPQVSILAPPAIVQAAVGNLLRNAIEHSDRGCVRVALEPDGVVTIDDPGHGMPPEAISALYGALARGAAGEGAGIGLELIARLCEHMRWMLEFAPHLPHGTTTRLRMGDATVQQPGTSPG